LMLVRDEEALLRRHLPSWLPLLAASRRGSPDPATGSFAATPALVAAVDDRSSDASARILVGPPPPPEKDRSTTTTSTTSASGGDDGEVVIPLSLVPRERRHVFHYAFDGLGPGRSLLLAEAWHRFRRTVTHYFFADPDWRLDVAPHLLGTTANSAATTRRRRNRGSSDSDSDSDDAFGAALRGELVKNQSEDAPTPLVFAFKIFDRNGHSERWLDWFLRAREGLRFKYRWHESLDVPPEEYIYSDVQAFTVTETEGQDDSYHLSESGGSNTIRVSEDDRQE
jgi:hypothetical protein